MIWEIFHEVSATPFSSFCELIFSSFFDSPSSSLATSSSVASFSYTTPFSHFSSTFLSVTSLFSTTGWDASFTGESLYLTLTCDFGSSLAASSSDATSSAAEISSTGSLSSDASSFSTGASSSSGAFSVFSSSFATSYSGCLTSSSAPDSG